MGILKSFAQRVRSAPIHLSLSVRFGVRTWSKDAGRYEKEENQSKGEDKYDRGINRCLFKILNEIQIYVYVEKMTYF